MNWPKEDLVIRLPKQTLLDILQQLPKKELEAIMREITQEPTLRPVRATAQSLEALAGLISLGGDALEDTEAIHE